MPKPQKTVGERLAEAREARGLEQADLAGKIPGATQSVVSLWESDKRKLSAEKLIALVRALRIDAHWLLTGDGDMDRHEPEDEARAFRAIVRYVRRIQRESTLGDGERAEAEKEAATLPHQEDPGDDKRGREAS